MTSDQKEIPQNEPFVDNVYCLLAAPVLADTDMENTAGRILAQAGGRQIVLPLLRNDIAVQIDGDMAHVEFHQTFENPTQVPVQADYLFPLNQTAAIHGMQMIIGDEIIRTQICEKEIAEQEFKQASDAGKAAALLSQNRPNMFTQRIANLMPGLPVEVRLSYAQIVPKIEGRYELVIPFVVGPRYEILNVQIAQQEEPAQDAVWSVGQIPA